MVDTVVPILFNFNFVGPNTDQSQLSVIGATQVTMNEYKNKDLGGNWGNPCQPLRNKTGGKDSHFLS